MSCFVHDDEPIKRLAASILNDRVMLGLFVSAYAKSSIKKLNGAPAPSLPDPACQAFEPTAKCVILSVLREAHLAQAAAYDCRYPNDKVSGEFLGAGILPKAVLAARQGPLGSFVQCLGPTLPLGKPLSLPAAHKLITSILYQTSEGDIREKSSFVPVLNLLESLCWEIANAFITKSEEWDAASWS